MSTTLKRLSVTIPLELEQSLDELKKEKFYKDSQSEMLRHLLKLGLQATSKKEEKQNAKERIS